MAFFHLHLDKRAVDCYNEAIKQRRERRLYAKRYTVRQDRRMITLQKNDVLLFQGDSITHGGRIQSNSDMNHIMGHGYQSILASRIGFDNWERRPEIRNRGVSGDTVAKMLARWESDTFALQPTVLSILIGTNDCGFCYSGSGPDADMFEKEYRFLLDYTLDRFPDIRLILCEPFRYWSPLAATDPVVHEKDEWNVAHCKEYAARVRKIAAEYKTVFVPFAAVLTPYVEAAPVDQFIWDGIHPTYVGHEIMARTWYDTVEKSGILA